MDKLKDLACSTIDINSENLYNLSQDIWLHPELCYEEVYAHKVLTDFLEKQGFEVTRSYKLDTAFKAVYGTEGGANIAVLCEYDALPEIGHACGHNLIAEVGVAAGMAVKSALEKAGNEFKGKVTVLGTPAEEGGGGKVELIKAGAFDDIDAAMMAHPSNITVSRPLFLALRELRIEFHGKATHASSYPWEGVNALDAAVMMYQSVSNLRQQMKPTWRVHGIISNGGAQANIIPELTEMRYYVRAPTTAEMNGLYDKVVACGKAAALATGCTVNILDIGSDYTHLTSNGTMSRLLEQHSRKKDLRLDWDESYVILKKYGGSTDMGNVSQVLPSIHPKYFIAPCSNHSQAFTAAAGSREAQTNTLNVAKALAMVTLDLIYDPKLLQQAKDDFKKEVEDKK